MEEKRSHIIETARRLFLQNGFTLTSMEDVAKESGMGKASLYHYFAGKEELFNAIIDAENDDMSSFITDYIKNGKTVAEKIRLYIDAKFTRLKERYELLSKSKTPIFHDLGKQYFVIMSKFGQRDTELLAALFVTGMTSGEFKPADPLKLAQLMVSMFWGHQFSIYHKGCMDGFSEPTFAHAEQQSQLFVDVMLNGILQNKTVQE